MKYLFFALFALFAFAFVINVNNTQNNPKSSSNLKHNIKKNKMKLKIGSNIFMVTLYDNETTEALKAKLPLTLNMKELNSNEKYAQLSTDLPENKENIENIEKGDLMLWGANTLVLFYKSFKTPYQYTKIGHIDNPIELVSAVGKGNVTIIFEAE